MRVVIERKMSEKSWYKLKPMHINLIQQAQSMHSEILSQPPIPKLWSIIW